jgi:type II secretory pathway pseudopilin PulG
VLLNKKGRVWVETVLYTLIGLALIGLVLAIAMPRINETRDRATVEQTIDSLSILDGKIGEVLKAGPGNVRVFQDFQIKRGEIHINSVEDEIVFVIDDLSKPYSELGVPIEFGEITVLSESGAKFSTTSLTLKYGDVADITYGGVDEARSFGMSVKPYKFSIKNAGDVNAEGMFLLEIKEISA